MNIDDVAVGVIGSTFGLGPGALAAVGAARYFQQKMRKINPGGNPYKVDFQMPFKRRRVGGKPAGGIPNVVLGGVGAYKGDFYKRSQGVVESNVTQYGFQRESEHFGVVKCPDIQYFGVQNINAVMAARGIAVAYLRMIFWRHFKQTYASEGDLLYEGVAPFSSDVKLIEYVYGSRDSTGAIVIGAWTSPVISGGVTTLNTLVNDLTTRLETQPHFGLIHYTGASTAQSMLLGYRIHRNDGSVSPIYYTDNQTITYNCTTVVQFQNQTLADNVGISAGISRLTNDVNPIVGKVFTTKGLFPYIEKQYRSEWDDQLCTNTDIPSFAGLIIPTVAPTGAWRSIPTPQVFANIIKCETGLRLEAGEIKKDVLRFRFRGTMRALFDGLRVNAIDSTSGAGILESDYTTSLGYNKLFAFEKVVPTGVDQVSMAYHLDRYHTCVMGLEYFQHSCRREFAKSLFNRTINPA